MKRLKPKNGWTLGQQHLPLMVVPGPVVPILQTRS